MGALPATPREAADWVEDQARQGPLLLIVEDGHWADPSTMESVHLIARDDAPVLIAMTARPEIEEDPHVEPDVQLTLTGLGEEDARALIERLPESGATDT